MSEYENELASEREYVAGLYGRLDAERARAGRRYADALRDHEGRAVDREGDVMTSAREVRRLGVAEAGLAFGRLDGDPRADGGVDVRYVGRLGLFDPDDVERELLLDWRARRRGPSTPPPAHTPRACTGGGSSSAAGANWSSSRTRCWDDRARTRAATQRSWRP
ncbi:hypothetical protein GCM10009648_08690 [Tsukamurella spumae]